MLAWSRMDAACTGLTGFLALQHAATSSYEMDRPDCIHNAPIFFMLHCACLHVCNVQLMARLQNDTIVKLLALVQLPPAFCGLPTRRPTWSVVMELLEVRRLVEGWLSGVLLGACRLAFLAFHSCTVGSKDTIKGWLNGWDG